MRLGVFFRKSLNPSGRQRVNTFGSKLNTLFWFHDLSHNNIKAQKMAQSIKGSKDSGSSLVSNENFSEILWSSRCALGQAT